MHNYLPAISLATFCIVGHVVAASGEAVAKSATPQVEAEKQGSIALKIDNPIVGGGDAVRVDIQVKNNGYYEFSVIESTDEWDYNFVVEKRKKDDKGHMVLVPAAYTDYGKQRLTGMRAYTRLLSKQIMPGHVEEDHVVINRLFDMSTSGTYFLRVSCYASWGRGGEERKSVNLKSPPLQITVR